MSLVLATQGATVQAAEPFKQVSIATLRDSMGNLQKTERLNRRRIVVEGLVHGYAEFSILLDLRASADRLGGTDDEHPGVDECVGLAVPEELFEKVKGARVLRVYGTTFVLGSLQGVMHGAVTYRGVKFSPECGYFSEESLYILVDHVDASTDQSR